MKPAEEKQNLEILETIRELLDVLCKHSVQIGSSSMVRLLIENAQKSETGKKEWLVELEELWEYYKE